jgi:hypothetical protein
MGWRFGHYGDITAQLDEHGGDKEARDEQLWNQFVAEADAAVKRIAGQEKYSALTWYLDD